MTHLGVANHQQVRQPVCARQEQRDRLYRSSQDLHHQLRARDPQGLPPAGREMGWKASLVVKGQLVLHAQLPRRVRQAQVHVDPPQAAHRQPYFASDFPGSMPVGRGHRTVRGGATRVPTQKVELLRRRDRPRRRRDKLPCHAHQEPPQADIHCAELCQRGSQPI